MRLKGFGCVRYDAEVESCTNIRRLKEDVFAKVCKNTWQHGGDADLFGCVSLDASTSLTSQSQNGAN
jgi:hypothetical protein